MIQLALFDLEPLRRPKPDQRFHRWQRMVRFEPRLLALEQQALDAASRPACSRDAFECWHRITAQLRRLAGWFAVCPHVSTQADYDCAYRHLMQVYFDARKRPLEEIPS